MIEIHSENHAVSVNVNKSQSLPLMPKLSLRKAEKRQSCNEHKNNLA